GGPIIAFDSFSGIEVDVDWSEAGAEGVTGCGALEGFEASGATIFARGGSAGLASATGFSGPGFGASVATGAASGGGRGDAAGPWAADCGDGGAGVAGAASMAV